MQKEPMLNDTYQRLTKELMHLKNVERANIAKIIDEARALGDLKENAEYHAAKDKQGHMESRIIELQDLLSRAQVVDPASFQHTRVSFGSTITLCDLNDDSECKYTIVGAQESNPSKGLISIFSPLAKALMGREEGDEVEVTLPSGVKQFSLEEICFEEICIKVKK
ncbi:MAG: transcription elongation factor GreA [Campylobacterales bacterium]|nr:transcription elongation factor GreA [Campylobacterales bacterium]